MDIYIHTHTHIYIFLHTGVFLLMYIHYSLVTETKVSILYFYTSDATLIFKLLLDSLPECWVSF